VFHSQDWPDILSWLTQEDINLRCIPKEMFCNGQYNMMPLRLEDGKVIATILC
jgi:hypothetical protein